MRLCDFYVLFLNTVFMICLLRWTRPRPGDLGLLNHPPDQTLPSSQDHLDPQQGRVVPMESLQHCTHILHGHLQGPSDIINNSS